MKKIETDCRGFYEYGKFTDARGTSVRVKESSIADGPHVWVFIKQDPSVYRNSEPGDAAAHLNEAECRQLIALLQKHLDAIQARWGGSR